MSSSYLPIIASILLAAFPVYIWLNIIHREGEEKGLYIKTFLLGTLAVVPPFLLILLFQKYPHLDVYTRLEENIMSALWLALATNGVVGIIEEIAKNFMVRVVDARHPEYFQTITSALKLSLCAGLGFSFAENIFYFYNVWINPEYGKQILFSTVVFRSVFTMCGHMVFSGIFGYFFGMGKFATDLTEFSRFSGERFSLARLIAKITGRMTPDIEREMKNFTGLFLAMGLHAAFNASLELGHQLLSITIVAGGALYVWYLLHTKAGHLLFSIVKRRGSSMAAKDEEVVLELLGMWSREGKFRDVIQICDRLLERDPDNNVVKLFRARAKDNEKLRKVYEILRRRPAQGTAPLKNGANTIASAPEDTTAKNRATEKQKLSMQDEKVVLEVMETWYQEGKYGEVLKIANRLLEKNPQSEGARVLLEKAIDKTKLDRITEALGKLFEE